MKFGASDNDCRINNYTFLHYIFLALTYLLALFLNLSKRQYKDSRLSFGRENYFIIVPGMMGVPNSGTTDFKSFAINKCDMFSFHRIYKTFSSKKNDTKIISMWSCG